MDAAPPAEAPVARSALQEMSTPRKATFWGFAALFLAGVAFYFWWGLSFGIWIDNGVYAVTVTLVGFGLAGMWLVMPNPPAPALPPTP
ncbi:MAG TPA: hypothetical protein VMG36_06440 [Thermoplasmata archaeon]|nr:hypothetical protein [Thermoplasmata archaeon]